MKQAIEQRISRRTYKKEPLTQIQVDKIKSLINEINEVSNLSLLFIEDGSAAFSSLKTTYGLFKNVYSLILMKGQIVDEHLKEKVGYYGEEVMLKLVNMGLGSCWVGGTFDKKVFTITENEQIICVMLVGVVDKLTRKDRLIISKQHNKRKPISERLSIDGVVPNWIRAGMEAVQLAPSAMNKQKPHFIYKNEVLNVTVPDDYQMDLVDLGIAKKHFELGTGEKFDLGNGATWKE